MVTAAKGKEDSRLSRLSRLNVVLPTFICRRPLCTSSDTSSHGYGDPIR